MGRSFVTFLRIILAAALTLMAGIVVSAQDTKEYQERKARLEKEIAIIDNQLRNTAKASTNALGNLSLIRKKMASRKELLERSEKQITAYSNAIATKEKEIRDTKAALDTLELYNAKLIRGAYKNRSPKVWYMYILASDNLGQAFRRFGYLKNISGQLKKQADKTVETKEKLERETIELARLKEEAEKVKASREEEVRKLQGEENESRNVVNQLNKNKKNYQKQLDSKRKEVEALNREIERIIREAMSEDGKKGSSGKASSGSKPRAPIDYKLADEFAKNKGKLPWPAEGPVVDRFGQHYHPVYTNVKLPFNNGVSIALRPGTEIRAVFNGVVKQVIVMPGYNKCVLVQHGNYFSFYCKLGNVSVKAGDKVSTNQVIGTVDTIGGETQLHFQVWQNRTPQNPETWLRP